ncbi:MAG: stage II sporulation protein R [Clostridia bacterium]|nr:stage II sporulation protein R [Clostridia bacterium]
MKSYAKNTKPLFLRRFLFLFSLFLLLGAVGYSYAAVMDANEIANGVVRLHILADSDEKGEQALKLSVRDAILDEYSDVLSSVRDRKEALKILEEKLPEIKALAGKVVREAGYGHEVTVSLTQEYYPTRVYDGFTLPAGDYASLRVLIGSGEGKNWFCMVYPPLCTASSEAEESFVEAGFSDDQVRFLTEGEKGYAIRFKVVEAARSLWQTVKGWFS